MSVTFQLKILTPAKMVLDESVISIVAPGEAGYLGVLANHAPLITTLRDGEVKVKTDAGEKRFRVSGGILRVARNTAVLLTESAEAVEG